jgi:hypothetical protein
MRSSTSFCTVATIVFAVTLAVVSSGKTLRSPAPAPAKLTELAWMSGDWQTPAGGKAQIEEHWTLPAGGTMIGMGRTVVGGKTAEFEFLRLEQRGGDVFYVANPNARCPQTDFKLTSLSPQEAVFENLEHDFPKRVIYRKTSAGLVASVDGGVGTKSQTFTYVPMRK